jgi:hypothetical protein
LRRKETSQRFPGSKAIYGTHGLSDEKLGKLSGNGPAPSELWKSVSVDVNILQ